MARKQQIDLFAENLFTASGTVAKNSYATDGLCHNAEPGTYGHECSKPATWLGTHPHNGFTSGYCDDCKANGFEASGCQWERIT